MQAITDFSDDIHLKGIDELTLSVSPVIRLTCFLPPVGSTDQTPCLLVQGSTLEIFEDLESAKARQHTSLDVLVVRGEENVENIIQRVRDHPFLELDLQIHITTYKGKFNIANIY